MANATLASCCFLARCSARDTRNLSPWLDPTEPDLGGEHATARSRGPCFGPAGSEAERWGKLPEESVQTQRTLKVLRVSETLPRAQRQRSPIEVKQEQQKPRGQGNEMWSVHAVEEHGPQAGALS